MGSRFGKFWFNKQTGECLLVPGAVPPELLADLYDPSNGAAFLDSQEREKTIKTRRSTLVLTQDKLQASLSQILTLRHPLWSKWLASKIWI